MQGPTPSPLPIQDSVKGRLLGHYRVSAATGATTGLSAADPILSFRWTDTAAKCVFTRIRVGAVINTAFGTAQAVDADAMIVRAFTAVDSGGTALTRGATNPKNQTGMGSSLVNDLRVATTSALTAGTRTLDSNPVGLAVFNNGNAIGNADTQEVYEWNMTGQYPLVLSVNEGLLIRVPTAQGATGKVVYYVTLGWAEVDPTNLWLA